MPDRRDGETKPRTYFYSAVYRGWICNLCIDVEGCDCVCGDDGDCGGACASFQSGVCGGAYSSIDSGGCDCSYSSIDSSGCYCTYSSIDSSDCSCTYTSASCSKGNELYRPPGPKCWNQTRARHSSGYCPRATACWAHGHQHYNRTRDLVIPQTRC